MIVGLIGGIFILIGQFMVWDYFSWQKKGRRIRAMLVGLREQTTEDSDGEMQTYYWPVVEYAGPDGVTVRAECDTASGGYDMLPGKLISVLVRDDRPDTFTMPGKSEFVLGIVVGGIGLFIILLFFNVYMLGVIVLITVYFSSKLRKGIDLRGQSKTLEKLKELSDSYKAERESLSLLDAEAMRARQRNEEKQGKAQYINACFSILVGGIFCYVSYYMWQDAGGQFNQDGWISMGITSGLGLLALVSGLITLARSGSKRL